VATLALLALAVALLITHSYYNAAVVFTCSAIPSIHYLRRRYRERHPLKPGELGPRLGAISIGLIVVGIAFVVWGLLGFAHIVPASHGYRWPFAIPIFIGAWFGAGAFYVLRVAKRL
jgi:MFS family permease